MDPFTITVVTILGKYAIDKGADLAKEAGPKAAEIAGDLFKMVAKRFGRNPADAQNLERFEKKPETYQAVVADSLEEQMKDPEFAGDIMKLLAKYHEESPPTAPGVTTISQIARDNAIQIGQAENSTITISRDPSSESE